MSPDEVPIEITDDMLVTGDWMGARRDFERGMSYAPRLTLLLIATNVAVFVWELSSGALGSLRSILAAGALRRAEVLAGEYWRLGTAVFLHGSPDHLIGNCIVLYIVGMALEHALAPAQSLIVFALSGLAGSLLSITVRDGPSLGASGAIFGVMTAVIVILYKHRRVLRVRDRRIGLVLAVWAGYTILTGFATPYVDNFAHLGGVIGGALAGWFAQPVLLARRQPSPHGAQR